MLLDERIRAFQRVAVLVEPTLLPAPCDCSSDPDLGRL